MTRKPPKRAGESKSAEIPTPRITELADIVVDDHYVLGPRDVSDLVELLYELADRRDAEQLRQTLAIDERSAA